MSCHVVYVSVSMLLRTEVAVAVMIYCCLLKRSWSVGLDDITYVWFLKTESHTSCL